jgi:hypothetical protein
MSCNGSTDSLKVEDLESDKLSRKAEVRTRIKPQLCDGEGRWTADYVRLRFEARLTN